MYIRIHVFVKSHTADMRQLATNNVATGVSRVNIRLLPFSTSYFYIAV